MNARKPLMLIVDDAELNREILAQQFSREFDILQAGDGIEAVALIEKHLAELTIIILDLQMPVADGYYVLDKMLTNNWVQVPVIVATASEDMASELKAIEMGASDYIVKPVNYRLLKNRIDSAVAKRQAMMLIMENERLLTKNANDEIHRKELYYAATHDDLTGVFSKRGFYEEVANRLAEYPEGKFSILRLGIKHFKIVNDLFGFPTGDLIIKEIAAQSKIIPDSICAHVDGDNFFIFCSTDAVDVNLLHAVEKKLCAYTSNYRVELICGIYNIEDYSMTVSAMCHRAVLAENQAKRDNVTYVYYDKSLIEQEERSRQILLDFESALANKEFTIYLQPIIGLALNEIVCAEALVRWIHPTKGLIPPGVFIEVLEQNGRIARLDYCVWDMVCQYLLHRKNSGKTQIPISVNVSRIHLSNPDLPALFNNLTAKYGIEHELLQLEITETAYVVNKDLLLSVLSELKEDGYKIVMDDFGSGYSSVNMLKDMPVDVLKIDMQLIEDVATSSKASSIAASVISMARMLNITVVAEGVEQYNQVSFLRSVGCDRIQGYFYSPPMPLSRFESDAQLNELLARQKPEHKENEDISDIFNASGTVARLLDSVYGAVAFYTYRNRKLAVLRVNQKYYDIMGYTIETIKSDLPNMFEKVHTEDLPAVRTALDKVAETGEPTRLLFRRFSNNGELLYLDTLISFVGGTRRDPLVCIAFSDITPYLKDKTLDGNSGSGSKKS